MTRKQRERSQRAHLRVASIAQPQCLSVAVTCRTRAQEEKRFCCPFSFVFSCSATRGKFSAPSSSAHIAACCCTLSRRLKRANMSDRGARGGGGGVASLAPPPLFSEHHASSSQLPGRMHASFARIRALDEQDAGACFGRGGAPCDRTLRRSACFASSPIQTLTRATTFVAAPAACRAAVAALVARRVAAWREAGPPEAGSDREAAEAAEAAEADAWGAEAERRAAEKARGREGYARFGGGGRARRRPFTLRRARRRLALSRRCPHPPPPLPPLSSPHCIIPRLPSQGRATTRLTR